MEEISPSNLYIALSEGGFFGKPSRPRRLILDALREFETTSGRKLIILQAPPGYGKTAISYSIGLSTMLGYSEVFRTIHILPLRSIVEDVWFRLRNYLTKLGLQEYFIDATIGAQMMYTHGSPFLQKKLVFTTIDTFFMSAVKLPPVEISRVARGRYGYYEVPRASIMQSATIFDEVHLFMDEGIEGKVSRASKALITILRLLIKVGVPVIVMSATMPTSLINELIKRVRIISNIEVKQLLYGKNCTDSTFEEEKIQSKVLTHPVVKAQSSEDSLMNIKKIVEDLGQSYRRVIIVLNTIPRALKLYQALDTNALLLHSRFTAVDRSLKLSAIRDSDKWTLVATQVVEAGVDISALLLISDIAPANSLIQRVGRICRKGEEEGEVVVVYSGEDVKEGYGIYNPKLIERTLNYLKTECKNLLWHLPRSNPPLKGYEEMIEYVYARYSFKLIPDKQLWELLTIPFQSSQSALELYLEYGNFTRDSSILPLIILPERFQIGDILNGTIAISLIYERSVPVDAKILYKLAKNDDLMILEKVDKEYVIKAANKNSIYVRDLFYQGKGIPHPRLSRLMLLGKLLGYATSPQNYNYETGLRMI